MSDRYYAILPKEYPLSSDTFPIQQFNGTKFLMPGLGYDDDIGQVFNEYKVHPFVTPTYVDDPAILSMVEHNLGISMLSALTIADRHDAVRIVPISPFISRNICVAVKGDKALTPPMKRLIAITKEVARTYVPKI